MMRRLGVIALAAVMAFATCVPLASEAEARRRGAAIAAGVLVGAAALAIAAGAANAGERRSYSYEERSHYRSGGDQCRRWHNHCEDGRDWACRKFDRHC